MNTWSRFARQRGERLRPHLAYPALATPPPPAAASTTTLAAARQAERHGHRLRLRVRGLGFRRTQPGRGWLQRCSALTARRRFSAFCRARQGATSSRRWRRSRAARCAHHAHRQRRAKTALPALASTFFPPATSLLSDEDMCMCIHNKPVGCLEACRSHPPINYYGCGLVFAPPATASHFAPRRLSIFVGLDGEYLEPFCKAGRGRGFPR